MAEYTAWYRVGTAALTKNSKIVTGSGTFWLAAGLHTGDIFSVDCVTEYEIASIDSNTQITLRTPYLGDSTAESAYRIIRNFTASMAAETAAMTAALLNDFRRYVDADMQSIHGKSAYQIACDKGFAGTESEWLASLIGKNAYEVAVAEGFNGTKSAWLESLKAGNEWSLLDDRTDILTYSNGGIRNALPRGIDLGEFTAEHLAEIKAGTFRGMWLRDWFTVNGKKYTIAGFNYFGLYEKPSLTILGPEDTLKYVPDDNPTALYPETLWYTEKRLELIEQFEGIFGAENIPTFPVYAIAGFTGSQPYITPNAWVQLSSKVHLPTFSMIYGPIFSGFHHAKPYLEYSWGTPARYYYPQLPLFRAGCIFYGIQLSDVEGPNGGGRACTREDHAYLQSKTPGLSRLFPVFHIYNERW